MLLEGLLKNGLYERDIAPPSASSPDPGCFSKSKSSTFVSTVASHLPSDSSVSHCLSAITSNTCNSDVWHARLGHPSSHVLAQVLSTLPKPVKSIKKFTIL